MEQETQKVFGYTLLAFGLIMLLIAVLLVINVFTGNTNPPEISKIESFVVASAAPVGATGGIQVGPMEIRLNKEINKVINMMLWCFFMAFIAMSGSRLAGLGIQMLKNS